MNPKFKIGQRVCYTSVYRRRQHDKLLIIESKEFVDAIQYNVRYLNGELTNATYWVREDMIEIDREYYINELLREG